LHYLDGTLWILTSGQEEEQGAPDPSGRVAELKVATMGVSRLWRYQPSSARFEAIGGTNGQQLTAVRPMAGRMWVGDERRGLGQVDLNSTTIEFLPTNALPSGFSVLALSASSGKIFAMGRSDHVYALNSQTGSWSDYPPPPLPNTRTDLLQRRVTADSQWLLTAGQRLALQSVADGKVVFFDDALFDEAPVTGGAIHCMQSRAPGEFWIGSTAGLHRFNAQARSSKNWFAPPGVTVRNPMRTHPHLFDPMRPTGGIIDMLVANNLFIAAERRAAYHRRKAANLRVQNPVEPSSRLIGPVTALCPDGDYLWLGCAVQDGGTVALYHAPSDRWIGQVSLNMTVNAIAVSDSMVWIGLAAPTRLNVPITPVAMVQMKKKPFIDRRTQDEQPDAVDSAELASKVSQWSHRQQAVYAFFRARYAESVQLIGELDPETADVETLFLAGLAHDELGLKNPTLQHRYLQAIIDRDQQGRIANVIRNILQPPTTGTRPGRPIP
jgi:hypothetical protein